MRSRVGARTVPVPHNVSRVACCGAMGKVARGSGGGGSAIGVGFSRPPASMSRATATAQFTAFLRVRVKAVPGALLVCSPVPPRAGSGQKTTEEGNLLAHCVGGGVHRRTRSLARVGEGRARAFW